MSQEKFSLDIRGNFFMERVLKDCNGLPRAVVASLALEVFKKKVWMWHLRTWLSAERGGGAEWMDLLLWKPFPAAVIPQFCERDALHSWLSL